MGWDEILAGGPAESAAVAYRRWYTGGIAAAETGHKVVTCPQQEVHLDHVQSHDAREPAPFGRVHTLEDVYVSSPYHPDQRERLMRPKSSGSRRKSRASGLPGVSPAGRLRGSGFVEPAGSRRARLRRLRAPDERGTLRPWTPWA
ncbi:family 20 glycosylhydrolase [Nonomuraea jabiensis]|uniref:family 20 glycosylhydrolase n=1 Tax=Nonomuraea jabiensis TaxID=882448 RepID=UPI0035E45F47